MVGRVTWVSRKSPTNHIWMCRKLPTNHKRVCRKLPTNNKRVVFRVNLGVLKKIVENILVENNTDVVVRQQTARTSYILLRVALASITSCVSLKAVKRIFVVLTNDLSVRWRHLFFALFCSSPPISHGVLHDPWPHLTQFKKKWDAIIWTVLFHDLSTWGRHPFINYPLGAATWHLT